MSKEYKKLKNIDIRYGICYIELIIMDVNIVTLKDAGIHPGVWNRTCKD